MLNLNFSKDELGIGTQIESEKGLIYLKIKCINDGVLDIRLRGVDFYLNDTRIPIYINYTDFRINNEKILLNKTIVWHDKPFYYKKNVKDGEILDIYFEWEPI